MHKPNYVDVPYFHVELTATRLDKAPARTASGAIPNRADDPLIDNEGDPEAKLIAAEEAGALTTEVEHLPNGQARIHIKLTLNF